jgi:hypothetical protein
MISVKFAALSLGLQPMTIENNHHYNRSVSALVHLVLDGSHLNSNSLVKMILVELLASSIFGSQFKENSRSLVEKGSLQQSCSKVTFHAG